MLIDMNDTEHTPAGLGVTQEIGQWQVFMRWENAGALGGPRYLTIRPHPDATPDQIAGGLSSTVVRQIDFQRALTAWREFSTGDDTATTEFEKRISSVVENLTTILRAAQD